MPDEQEVNDFYAKRTNEIKKPFYQAKSEITNYLTRLYALQAKQQWFNDLAKRGDLIILPDQPPPNGNSSHGKVSL